MVWPCALSVSEYAAAEKEVEVPELPCPGCDKPLRPWSWYLRPVRAGVRQQIWIRPGHCPAPTSSCPKTQALLPEFVVERRLNVVDTIFGLQGLRPQPRSDRGLASQCLQAQPAGLREELGPLGRADLPHPLSPPTGARGACPRCRGWSINPRP